MRIRAHHEGDGVREGSSGWISNADLFDFLRDVLTMVVKGRQET